jgi:hypothetical protein
MVNKIELRYMLRQESVPLSKSLRCVHRDVGLVPALWGHSYAASNILPVLSNACAYVSTGARGTVVG